MAMNIAQKEIMRFHSKAKGAINRANAKMAKADEAVATAVTTAEVSAASFLFGLAQGKFGGVALVGVPVDLLAGIGLHLAAFAGIGGKQVKHLHAFADGALASYMNGLGRQVGRSIQTPSDRARIATSAVKGELDDGMTGGASLADEELARMAAAGL
jgi:hypothetical protein